MNLKISNEEKVKLLSFHELPDEEKASFDYDGAEDHNFVKYMENYYDLADFMALNKYAPEEFKEYQGYFSNSFFSGVLLSYTNVDPDFYDDYEFVKMAMYIS